MDIGLITCRQYPALHHDDVLLRQSLSRLGLSSGPVIWEDHQPDRLPARAWMMRSAWDYHLKYDRFRHWLDSLPAYPPMFNDRDLIRWNTHKGYMLDLQARGCSIVPTELVRRGQALPGGARQGRWVAKPAVGAGAIGARSGDWATVLEHLTASVATHDMLLQPYIEGVESYSERSLIFLNGAFSHAVRRPLALIEGNREDDVMERVEPTLEELAAARKVMESLEATPLYARIDLLPGALLLELEVSEPRLFLREYPPAADTLADALALKIS